MSIAIVVLSLILAFVCLGAGAVKLIEIKQFLRIRDRLGLGAQLWRAIGIVEVEVAVGLSVGLAIPWVGIAAAVGLTVVLIGAIVIHASAGETRNAAPAIVLVVLTVLFTVLRLVSV
jgi:DoxX-like family